MPLPTNYQDAMFSGRRKYRMIDNGDGTFSFEDQTNYSVVGSRYGAAEINAQNEAINDLAVNGGNRNLAVIEAGNTASQAYLAGEHVIVAGRYYVVTEAIAIDDAFVIYPETGYNIKSEVVGNEIYQLSQNLTISFADSSLPSTTTVNEYLQALVNKVFPKVLNLNNRSASEWTNTPGLSGSFTSFNPLTSVNYARGNYNNLIDYTNYNKIVYTVTKSDTSNLLILEPDGAFPNYTIQGSGTKSGEVDISGVTGLHRIAIQSTGGNVQFSKFQLE